MSRRNEVFDAIIDELDMAMIDYVVRHGKHLKIWFTLHGRRQRIICRVSPSDVNAQHHARAFARRMVREMRP